MRGLHFTAKYRKGSYHLWVIMKNNGMGQVITFPTDKAKVLACTTLSEVCYVSLNKRASVLKGKMTECQQCYILLYNLAFIFGLVKTAEARSS